MDALGFFYKKNGELFIPFELKNQWVIKVPTLKNRLRGSGSIGLTILEQYELKNKDGIIFIDGSARGYVVVPKEILMKYEPVHKMKIIGNAKMIASYPLKTIMEESGISLVKIPKYGDIVVEDYEKGTSGDIRKKFGL